MFELTKQFTTVASNQKLCITPILMESKIIFLIPEIAKQLGFDGSLAKNIINSSIFEENLDYVKIVGNNLKELKELLNQRSQRPLVQIAKNASHILVLYESGLYKLLARSDKPISICFLNWITREILPDLRTQGYYVMPGQEVEVEQKLVTRNQENALILQAIREISENQQKSQRELIQEFQKSQREFIQTNRESQQNHRELENKIADLLTLLQNNLQTPEKLETIIEQFCQLASTVRRLGLNIGRLRASIMELGDDMVWIDEKIQSLLAQIVKTKN